MASEGKELLTSILDIIIQHRQDVKEERQTFSRQIEQRNIFRLGMWPSWYSFYLLYKRFRVILKVT